MTNICEIWEEKSNHTTEEKLIGWTLINSYRPECADLANVVNLKNLSAFGRIIYGRMAEVLNKYPEKQNGPRMMDAVWIRGVKEHAIPKSYVYACHEAADQWVPFGPTELEIEELKR